MTASDPAVSSYTTSRDTTHPTCPGCQTRSTSRHSHYERTLWDLPIQGIPVRLLVRTRRWRCRNPSCERQIFTERLPDVATPHARRSRAHSDLVSVLGQSAGGRPAERLLRRLGLPASDSTVLRHLRRRLTSLPAPGPLRALGIDDWAWTKGQRYGTILADLEARAVVDVLPDRSANSVARWLQQHPEVAMICRDRHGLYAQGAQRGAPQARQVADRFHLLDNFRARLEQQLSRLHRPIRHRVAMAKDVASAAPQDNSDRPDVRTTRREQFDRVRLLYNAGQTAAAIVRATGFSRSRVDKWIRLEQLPERARMTPKPHSPGFYHAHLVRCWTAGVTGIRTLLAELRRLGYQGCRSRLAEYVSPWRRKGAPALVPVSVDLPVDPGTGTRTSALVAAALCMKPQRLLAPQQVATLKVLGQAVPEFRAIRSLTLQFRGLLRSGRPERLDTWIDAADASGIYALRRFARTLRRDADAVRNAIAEPWSSGQTEGQISRLKTLKRLMCGSAGVGPLRARMLPFRGPPCTENQTEPG